MATQTVYQFYAELEGYKPKMWRRFQVASDITVARLGYIIMTMYEMKASHLMSVEHERPLLTRTGRLSKRMEVIGRYDIPSDNAWAVMMGEDATKTALSQVDLAAPSRLTVWYDFGDDWRVWATLEKTIEESELPDTQLPCVLEGKGLGIIEDSGGVWGLAEIAGVLKEKKGKTYKQVCKWLGVDALDMAAFDLDDMNFRLKKIPDIYAKIYEQKKYPTQADISLIERKYLQK